MIVEALVVFGALALVAGLKIWLTWRRIKAAKPMKDLPPDDGEAPLQRR
jgi:hypothetical protein